MLGFNPWVTSLSTDSPSAFKTKFELLLLEFIFWLIVEVLYYQEFGESNGGGSTFSLGTWDASDHWYHPFVSIS